MPRWAVSTPATEFEITRDVVARLVHDHAPWLAHESLGAWYEGWDNVTVRLGASHAVRLPRLLASVPLAQVEHRWVPELASRLPVAVPVPVVIGEPSDALSAPWSIVEWIEGADAGEEPLSEAALADLGAALAALHLEAPADAPVCEWRAGPLTERLEDFAWRLTKLDGRVDADVASTIFTQAAGVESPASTWIHADIHARNLVVRDGRLVGMIDWGEMSRGSHLIDLAQVWVLVGARNFAAVMRAYGRPLKPDDAALFAGHAVDAATRLALSPDTAHSAPAWRALAELGVAPSGTS